MPVLIPVKASWSFTAGLFLVGCVPLWYRKKMQSVAFNGAGHNNDDSSNDVSLGARLSVLFKQWTSIVFAVLFVLMPQVMHHTQVSF